MSSTFLNSCLLQFRYYKELGEKTIEQVPEIKLSFQINNETNSINTIVKHLSSYPDPFGNDCLELDIH